MLLLSVFLEIYFWAVFQNITKYRNNYYNIGIFETPTTHHIPTFDTETCSILSEGCHMTYIRRWQIRFLDMAVSQWITTNELGQDVQFFLLWQISGSIEKGVESLLPECRGKTNLIFKDRPQCSDQPAHVCADWSQPLLFVNTLVENW